MIKRALLKVKAKKGQYAAITEDGQVFLAASPVQAVRSARNGKNEKKKIYLTKIGYGAVFTLPRSTYGLRTEERRRKHHGK